MRILLTGATGMVGRRLGLALIRAGHTVVAVSRNQRTAKLPFPCERVEGDLTAGPLDSPLLEGVEGVVHLMGDPIAEGRWTAKKKKRLVESRVQATKNLRLSLKTNPKVLVSTSAVGFYGDRGEEILTEDSSPGSDFLAELCQEWEKAAFAFQEHGGSRVVCLRLGIVLSKDGGALSRMRTPARLGVAGPLGSGRQWMSWIHIDDVVGIYLKALESSEMVGVYNAVAPQTHRNGEFIKKLAQTLNRPAFFRVPAFGLRLLFGEMSTALLSSQRASAEKIQQGGYHFLYPDLESALKSQLS